MTSEEEKKCPLCAEEMDWTDQQLKPCKCGYEVCVWCWHQIMDMAEKDKNEGRCPACRTPYDKEKIVGMEANCERLMSMKKDPKNMLQKAKPKKNEGRKDLSNVRVIQRKMAYVIGLPLSLADEDLLQRKEYFGQYGKVVKVSLSRTSGGAIQQFVNDSCSVYITYSKEEEAIRCIQSVHGFVLDGRLLRASFGTAKYCHAWLRTMPCTNPTCLYLHSIGAEEDSFSKDEEAALHTRNRVQQIVGGTQHMQRRSGNVLPPPLDEPFYSLNSQRDLHASLTSDGPMILPSSKDKDGGTKTTNKLTSFVDIVGRSSCDPEKEGCVAEGSKISNLCANFSLVTIDNDNRSESEYLDAMPPKVSSSKDLPIEVPWSKDTKRNLFKPYRETSNFSVLSGADFSPSDTCIRGQSCLIMDSRGQVLPGVCRNHRENQDLLLCDDKNLEGSEGMGASMQTLSHPIRISDHSNSYPWQGNDSLSDFGVGVNHVHNHVDETSIPFTCVNSAYSEKEIQSSSKLDRIFKFSTSFSNEEIVEQLRRLEDDHMTNDDENSAYDAVESSIISNILSMDFDSWDDSLNLSHSIMQFDGADGPHGSWKYQGSDQSRFSFAKDEGPANQIADIDSSLNSTSQVLNKEHYLHGPQHNVSRAQSLKSPPGFSVPSREPPPGFSPCDRANQVLNGTSGTPFVKTSSLPNDQYDALLAGNVDNRYDFDFIDPAILVMSRGKATNGLFSSGLDSGPPSTIRASSTYEDEARLWLLMQQSSSVYQGPKFSHIFEQDTPLANHELKISDRIGNGLSAMDDAFGFASRHTDQSQTYNPSASTLLSQQKYSNGRMSNGYIPAMEEVRRLQTLRNEVAMAEVERNERLGLNKFFPGHGDLMLQMPSSGDIYGRVYGL